ncbi:MAG: ankyrin repeat domain-containing protein [Pseudomonadota bacterium]
MTKPRDELLERYAEAAGQDPRRPSDRVRNAARAHSQMLRDQAAEVKRVDGSAPITTAANQPQWTFSWVASLAVVGLAGLLYLQIDQGAPEDRQIALGAPAPGPAPAPMASPAPAAKTAKATANAPPAAAEVAAGPAKMSNNTSDQIASAETSARDGRSETREQSIMRAPAAPTAPAATAAPAAAPPPPPLADTNRRAREMLVGTATEQFLQAARGGQVETIHRLLTQGVAINARDDRGNTALMLAVTHRQAPAVRALLNRGADPALVNQEGLTALRLASQMDMTDMVLLLQTHP